MSDDPEYSQTYQEIMEIWPEVASHFEGRSPAVIGGLLGNLLAKYMSGYLVANQAHMLASFIKMTLHIMAELNGGQDKLGDMFAEQENWSFEFSDSVVEKMEADPEAKAMVTEAIARIKNVMEQARTGKFQSVDEALSSIGMEKTSEEEIEALQAMVESAGRGRPN